MFGCHGYAIATDPAKGLPEEWDVLTCSHSGKVIMIKPGDDVYRCHCCGGFVHPSEVGKGCKPLERKLEAMEARARLIEAMSCP